MKISSVVSSISTGSSDDIVGVVRISFVAPKVATLSVGDDCTIWVSGRLVDSRDGLDVISV